ncbi:hypothetical protein Ancab_036708 [Ancistrocladus abbreviatus]
MKSQEGNSSDIRPKTEVGSSANASNNFTLDFVDGFNDVPSNKGDFDHSTFDPTSCPSKKAQSKVWDRLIKICAKILKDQKAQCKYCDDILGANLAKAHVGGLSEGLQDSSRSARECMVSHGSPVQSRREPGPCGLSTANCAKRSHGLSVRRGKSTQRHNRKVFSGSKTFVQSSRCIPELGGFLGVLFSSLQPSPVASGVEGVFRLRCSLG